MNTAAAANTLLAALPDTERRRVLQACDTVYLRAEQVLHQAGKRVRHVYFPTGSFIALVTPLDACAGLEVAVVGNEGMVGTALLLGVSASPLNHLVLGAGEALRLAATPSRAQLEHCPALRRRLGRYAHVKMQQIAQTTACTRYHMVEARLTCWLLMAHDRAFSNHVRAAQEFLAYMLGVRRVGITEAAGALQRSGFIHYRRGEITILDRPGLETRCCDCYEAAKALYRRVLGQDHGKTRAPVLPATAGTAFAWRPALPGCLDAAVGLAA